MRVPQTLPSAFAEVPFTYAEALDAGISPGRIRRRSVLVPSRGIRVPNSTGGNHADGPDIGSEIRPYTLVTQFSAASHATAFRLWKFPGLLGGFDERVIHISRPDHMAIPRRTGVRGHRGQFFEDEITTLDGLFITSRTRTWLDCARKMSIDEITVVADHLIRIPRPELEARTEPYATLGDLADMLDRHKGTPGIQKARLALEDARVGSDSGPETRLRLSLGRAGLPVSEVNQPVGLRAGVVRQPDLAFREFRVAVEYDGEGHSDPAQIVRDIEREEDFSAAGWFLVRVSKRHMANDARAAVAKVRSALFNRGWTPK